MKKATNAHKSNFQKVSNYSSSMFNLLKRSKNKKLKNKDREDLINLACESTSKDAIEGPNLNLEDQNLPKLHEKFPKSLKQSVLNENNENLSDKREQKFAKIYFESSSSERKNTKNHEFASPAAESKKTMGKSGVLYVNDSSAASGSGNSRSSAEKPNDSSSTPYGEWRKLAKRKSAKRKSLDFRRIDLDGVNSIIEAVVLNDDGDDDDDNDSDDNDYVDDKEKTASTEDCDDHYRHHDQVDRPDSERSRKDLRLLSQNERAEWSGRKSSTHSDVSESDKLQSNVKNNKTLKETFNNNELNATKSNGAANVPSIDQKESTTTKTTTTTKTISGSTKSVNGGKGVVESSVEAPIDNLKQIKRIRRRSLFHKSGGESKSDNSQVKSIKKLEKPEAKKTSAGPLEKGKRLFNNIFMARGRNNKNQRKRIQSSKVHQSSLSSSSLSSSSNKQLSEEPCCSKSYSYNQNAAVTTDHNICHNDTSNKTDSTITSDVRNSQNFVENENEKENDQNNSLAMLRRHLETTTNSPIRQCDPAASVQMISSNNNLKNASRQNVSGAGAAADAGSDALAGVGGIPQHRSNSAELSREQREIEKNNLGGRIAERASSEEPKDNQRRSSGDRRSPLTNAETLSSKTPSVPLHANCPITRAEGTEQISGNAENSDDFAVKNTTDKNSNKKSHRACNESADSRELTECTRRNQSQSPQNQQQQQQKEGAEEHKTSMGQTYGKSETNAENAPCASTPRVFRESVLPEAGDTSCSPNLKAVVVPKITVEDFSGNKSHESPNENEVFYDFESECSSRSHPLSSEFKIISNKNKSNNNEGGDDDSASDYDSDNEIFHEQVATSQPASFSIYRQHSPLRHSPVKLEDVPEQEEDEDEAIQADDSLLSKSRRTTSFSASPERFPLKNSNSNLSNGYPDSGIGGCGESVLRSTTTPTPTTPTTTTTTEHNNNIDVGKIIPERSSLPNSQKQPNRRHRSPFMRDSTSADCDDTILQCDEFDSFNSTTLSYASASASSSQTTIDSAGDRLVCIDSISLPDVVESTTSSPCNTNALNGPSTTPASSEGSFEQIININGATGNTMGNVHFIPIHVEPERCRGGGHRANSPNSPKHSKQRSFDDSVIGNGMNCKRFAHLNGEFDLSDKPTIEIIEDDESLKTDTNNSYGNNTEKTRFDVPEQQIRLTMQLKEAHKNVQNLETKVKEMQSKIENMEQELSTKTWNVERLQSELNASQREDEFVRKKLRLLQEEKTELRNKFNENEDEFKKRFEDLEAQYKELQEKLKNTQNLASNLHVQLASAQSEAEEWRNQVEKIRNELEEEIRILRSALENSEAERKICEHKWQKEYELLRTQHMDREETLMTDCEWQLRQMQRQWKDKLDKSEHERGEAMEAAEILSIELETRKQEVADLRHYEAEVKSLRGLVNEQHNSISILMNQIDNLKVDLENANSKLEDQLEAVAKIKYQCDNALCDKERQMVYRIDEVRNEAASFWENKLYTEMTRLKNELESVYVDERREALDKLQAEHIEELRALTTRYTANEDELRTELLELQERLDLKDQEYLDLRDKSDTALLQTRMHLDRADREYQNAMCREEDRREALEVSLRQEFEAEKQEMETKFQQRMDELKEEFAAEVQSSKQEMLRKHQKDLDKIKASLRAEKDAALQELAERHRQKLAAAEEQMKMYYRISCDGEVNPNTRPPILREIELRHQNDLKELKATYDEDKAVLDKRDMSNANEIEQLHRRCRCLTNLFEEMRMRYERRDPRPEDLREIDELRARCESQERDLFTLTATLREIQMQQSEKIGNQTKKSGKHIQKPPPKTIPTNCDVIYEENEERDTPSPSPSPSKAMTTQDSDDDDDDNNDEDEDEVANDDDDEDNNDDDHVELSNKKPTKLVNGTSSDIATNI